MRVLLWLVVMVVCVVWCGVGVVERGEEVRWGVDMDRFGAGGVQEEKKGSSITQNGTAFQAVAVCIGGGNAGTNADTNQS